MKIGHLYYIGTIDQRIPFTLKGLVNKVTGVTIAISDSSLNFSNGTYYARIDSGYKLDIKYILSGQKSSTHLFDNQSN